MTDLAGKTALVTGSVQGGGLADPGKPGVRNEKVQFCRVVLLTLPEG